GAWPLWVPASFWARPSFRPLPRLREAVARAARAARQPQPAASRTARVSEFAFRAPLLPMHSLTRIPPQTKTTPSKRQRGRTIGGSDTGIPTTHAGLPHSRDVPQPWILTQTL